MKDAKTEQLAQVIYDHEFGVDGDDERCRCGWLGDGDHAKHVARAIVARFQVTTRD